MVSPDIFPGPSPENLQTPKPIPPNNPLLYRFNLPPPHHPFLPRPRIIGQIQPTCFPLYHPTPRSSAASTQTTPPALPQLQSLPAATPGSVSFAKRFLAPRPAPSAHPSRACAGSPHTPSRHICPRLPAKLLVLQIRPARLH